MRLFDRVKVAMLLLAAIILGGCATPRYSTVFCLTRAQFDQIKQSQPGRIRGQLTGQADQDLKIVAGSAIRLRAHDDGLLEILGGCVDPNK